MAKPFAYSIQKVKPWSLLF